MNETKPQNNDDVIHAEMSNVSVGSVSHIGGYSLERELELADHYYAIEKETAEMAPKHEFASIAYPTGSIVWDVHKEGLASLSTVSDQSAFAWDTLGTYAYAYAEGLTNLSAVYDQNAFSVWAVACTIPLIARAYIQRPGAKRNHEDVQVVSKVYKREDDEHVLLDLGWADNSLRLSEEQLEFAALDMFDKAAEQRRLESYTGWTARGAKLKSAFFKTSVGHVLHDVYDLAKNRDVRSIKQALFVMHLQTWQIKQGLVDSACGAANAFDRGVGSLPVRAWGVKQSMFDKLSDCFDAMAQGNLGAKLDKYLFSGEPSKPDSEETQIDVHHVIAEPDGDVKLMALEAEEDKQTWFKKGVASAKKRMPVTAATLGFELGFIALETCSAVSKVASLDALDTFGGLFSTETDVKVGDAFGDLFSIETGATVGDASGNLFSAATGAKAGQAFADAHTHKFEAANAGSHLLDEIQAEPAL